MREIRRGAAVAAASAAFLILYDIAREPLASLPRSGLLGHAGESAGIGLLVYGGILLAILVPLALVVGRSRPEPGAAGGDRSSLAILGGAAAALIFLANAFAVQAERRAGAPPLSASWFGDAPALAAGAVASWWGASGVLRWCLRGVRPRRRLVMIVLLLAAPGLLAAIDVAASAGTRRMRPLAAAASGDHPDVVLILADTLRADAVSCYGGRRFATPAIDGLAAQGVRFGEATAQASWTNPSTATLLTSVMPREHGMVGHHGRITPGVPLLAEVLSARGYRTAGLVANLLVSRAFGFDRGFSHWEEDPDPSFYSRHPRSLISRVRRAIGLDHRPDDLTLPASAMVDRALRWWSQPATSPRFLYLHLMDPHDPYTPPAGLAREADPGYTGALSFRSGTLYSILRGERDVTLADLAHARALYDAEVAGMDHEIGRLLGALKPGIESGRTVVVFTADHGEEFMEHGGMGHEHTLYQELLHVPLIVVRRGDLPEGKVVSDPVRLLDVAPTLLDLAGLPPQESFKGRSLAPLMHGAPRPEAAERIVFSEEEYLGYRASTHLLRSARLDNWKVILSSPNVFGIGPWRREAFDLISDPGETSSRPPGVETVDDLEALLRGRVAKDRALGESQLPLDPETERRLRALGYIQ